MYFEYNLQRYNFFFELFCLNHDFHKINRIAKIFSLNPYFLNAYFKKKLYLCISLKIEAVEDKDYFKQFDVHFGSLSFGKHCFDLEVNNTFFEKHENEDITGANVHVRLEIEREETLAILHFCMSGTLYSTCDLCLEKLSIPIANTEKLILKIVSEPCQSHDDNIVFITENTHSYNVEQAIFEYLYALIPIRKVHGAVETETCNQEMLLLIENAKAKQTKQTDERWEALKNIKLEDN
jgi:uncharacterized metal-binding protein YceD (DUF177 family)